MSINYGSTAVIIPFAEAVSLRSRRSLRNAMRTAALLPSALSVLITIRRHFYLQLLLINPLLENSELNFFGFSALTKLLKNIIALGCNLAVITEVLLNVFFPNQPEFPTVKGPWQEIKQPPGAPPPTATPRCTSVAYHGAQKLFLWSMRTRRGGADVPPTTNVLKGGDSRWAAASLWRTHIQKKLSPEKLGWGSSGKGAAKGSRELEMGQRQSTAKKCICSSPVLHSELPVPQWGCRCLQPCWEPAAGTHGA